MWPQMAGGGLKAMGAFVGRVVKLARRSQFFDRTARRQHPRRLRTNTFYQGDEIVSYSEIASGEYHNVLWTK
jgi:hypothetical protein